MVEKESPCSHKPPHSTMLTDQKVLLVGSFLFCSSILYRIRRVKQVWQAFETLPTHSILVSPLSILSRILPRIPWISDGRNFSWENVYERQPIPSTVFFSGSHYISCLGVFAASNSDFVQLRSLFPSNTPQLVLADATAAKVGLLVSEFECRLPCSIYPCSQSFRRTWY